MVNMFKELIATVSVSGAEKNISHQITDMVKDYCDNTYTDKLGNLIAVKKCGKLNAKKVMLAAHMDEIGFIITFIEDEGYLRVAGVGGIEWAASSYSEVTFENGMKGLLVPDYDAKPAEFKAVKFYVDIGAKNKADAEKKVSIGDVCTITGRYTKLAGTRFAASKLDDKIGCAIIIKALEELKNVALDVDVYAVFTSQEEVGTRGAKTSSFAVMPDYSIAIDVTDTGDTPKADPMAVKLGGGAAVKIMDRSVICHREMITMMQTAAKEDKIPVQSEILTFGGTDTSKMQAAGEGSVAGAISIPTRYVHTGVEMCDMKDVEAAKNLLIGTIRRLK